MITLEIFFHFSTVVGLPLLAEVQQLFIKKEEEVPAGYGLYTTMIRREVRNNWLYSFNY